MSRRRNLIIVLCVLLAVFAVLGYDEEIIVNPKRFVHATAFFIDGNHNLIVMYAPGPHAEIRRTSWCGITLELGFVQTERWPPDYPWVSAMPWDPALRGWTQIRKPTEFDRPEFLGRFDSVYMDYDSWTEIK